MPRLELEKARKLIAQRAGFPDWAAFLESVGAVAPAARPETGVRAAGAYQQAAQDFVDAYEGDAAALQRLNNHYQRSFSFADVKAEIWRRVYAFRQRSSRVPKNFLQLAEGRMLVAQDAGFGSWER